MVNTLKDYNIDVAALQEIRWTGTGQIRMNDYVLYYKGLNDKHQFGTGFAVHKNLLSSVKEFNPIFERVCTIN